MTTFLSQPLVLLIAACEIGFWVLLAGGLAARYLLRWRRRSTVLLVAVPLLDVVLVTASLVDVANGSPPGPTHGLAALYLGFTVAFGHVTIRWADRRFAHRFAGGPPPPEPPQHGRERVVHEWREYSRLLLAWGVALVVIGVTALVAGTGFPAPAAWPADPLWSWAVRPAPVAVVWLVFWPLRATVFPVRREVDRVG